MAMATTRICLLALVLILTACLGPRKDEILTDPARRDALPGTWRLAGSDLPHGTAGLPAYKRFCGMRRGARLALARDGQFVFTVGGSEVIGRWNLLASTLKIDGWPDDANYPYPSNARWPVELMTPHALCVRHPDGVIRFERVSASVR